MATLKDLIQQRIDRLESVPDALQSKIDKQNELLFKTILKELNSLDIKGGQIVTSTENLAKVGGIIEKLREVLFGGDYLDAIKEFAVEINKQAALNNNILEKTIGTFEDSELYKATIQSAQRNALLLLDESAVNANLLEPLTQILTNSIVNNSSFTDAVETLRQNMTGEAALLSKYAGTYTKDAFAASDRQYAQLTSREHGIIFFRYDGGKVEDSREFCLERKGGYYHIDEIRAWGKHQNTDPSKFKFPAKSPVYENPNGIKVWWQGMNYDTNEATIFSYCGGYGCIDVLVPAATEYVPEFWIKRAIQLGYYKE